MTPEMLARFEQLVRRAPERPAIFALSAGDTVTRAELMARAASLQRAFDEARLPPRVPIVTALGNRVDFVAALVACLASGRPILPADPGTSTHSALELARAWGASGVLAPASSGTPPPDADLARSLALWRSRASPVEYDAAVMKLTSGVTGAPKAVLTSADHLAHDVDHIVTAMGIRPDDVQLGYIPLSHAYGLGNLVTALLWQGTAIALREAFTPHLLTRDAASTGARVFPGVPFMFDKLIEVLAPASLPSCLELLVSAGAPLTAPLVHSFHRTFGSKIHSFYGASETGGIAYDGEDDVDDVVRVGRPMPFVTITLKDVEGLPEAEGRRVHVAGPAVARAYAGAAPVQGDAFDADGFLTGDLGRFDDRGRLELCGRLSSFVNVAGRKVQPEQVAVRLREMPEIADACVIGVPCPSRGERLVALVVPRAGDVPPARMIRFCAHALPAYKVPRDFVVVATVPRDARGKLDRRAAAAIAVRSVTENP